MKAPKNIIDIINSNKTSLGDNPALPPELDDKFLVFLVNQHYNELSSHFDYIDIKELTQDLSKTLTECRRIEKNNKEALEKLCSIIVNDIFLIPNETITININLVDKVDAKQERLVPESTEEYSFDNIEDMKTLTDEVYKRRFLNSLIIGASMYYAGNVNAYAKELNKIDDRLPYLYKKIMCINDLLLFHTQEKPNSKETDGGRVDVYISDPNSPVRIDAQALIFPILLQETIKGLLELSIAHGLPKNREKAEYVMSKADFKLAEMWDQRLGLPLWMRIEKILSKIGKNSLDIGLNFLLMEISQMQIKCFNITMQELLAGTKTGCDIIDQIANKIHYQKERDEFDDYMNTQTANNELPLNDADFTSDELINDDLCGATILDEVEY